MNKYTIKVLEETVVCDSDMEESYGMVNVLNSNGKIVGTFQMCNTEIFDEEEYIKELEELNANELMSKPMLNNMPKQIIDLHNDLMGSSNLCIYASDMVEWFDTEKAYNQTWAEFIDWLETYVMEHKELEGLIDFTDGDNDYIVFGNFMSAFNLHDVEIDWKEVAQNLLSLADTLDYVGDYHDNDIRMAMMELATITNSDARLSCLNNNDKEQLYDDIKDIILRLKMSTKRD